MAHLALDSHDAVSQVQPRADACALSLQRGDARIYACCMLHVHVCDMHIHDMHMHMCMHMCMCMCMCMCM